MGYFAKNATAMDPEASRPGAGAFFPDGTSVPTIDGVAGLPGVLDARWSLPVAAYLLSLSAAPGTTTTDAQINSLRAELAADIMGMTTVTASVPDPPSSIRVITDSIAYITPLFTLGIGVITLVIVVASFWCNFVRRKGAEREMMMMQRQTLQMQQAPAVDASQPAQQKARMHPVSIRY
jgi:hypothetical protein